jgi:hypothetical protein
MIVLWGPWKKARTAAPEIKNNNQDWISVLEACDSRFDFSRD